MTYVLSYQKSASSAGLIPDPGQTCLLWVSFFSCGEIHRFSTSSQKICIVRVEWRWSKSYCKTTVVLLSWIVFSFIYRINTALLCVWEPRFFTEDWVFIFGLVSLQRHTAGSWKLCTVSALLTAGNTNRKNHTFVLCMFLLFGTELLVPQGWVYEAKTCDVFSKCLIFSSSILILNSDHDCVRTEKQWECSAERIVLHSDYYRPLCSLSDQTQIFEAAAERISTEQPLYHIKSDVNACFYVILLTSPTVLMCLLVYSYNETEALLHSFVSKFMLCFLIQIIVSPAKWFIFPLVYRRISVLLYVWGSRFLQFTHR